MRWMIAVVVLMAGCGGEGPAVDMGRWGECFPDVDPGLLRCYPSWPVGPVATVVVLRTSDGEVLSWDAGR